MTSPQITKNIQWKQWLRYGILAAITSLLIVFARKIDWYDSWMAIQQASPWILGIALAANFLTIIIRGFRWWLILRSLGGASLGLTLRATLVGTGLNNVILVNGGELARIMFVARGANLPVPKVVSTVALDRLFDPLGFVILLVVGAFCFTLPAEIQQFQRPAAILVGCVSIGLFWLIRRAPTEDLSATDSASTLPAATRGWWTKGKAWIADFGQQVRDLMKGPYVLWIIGLTVFAWITQLATFALVLEAMHLTLPVAASFTALLMTNLTLIARLTPGNVGIFQFTYLLAVIPFGADRDTAIAVAILIQALQVIPVTVLGVALAPELLFRKRSGQTAQSV